MASCVTLAAVKGMGNGCEENSHNNPGETQWQLGLDREQRKWLESGLMDVSGVTDGRIRYKFGENKRNRGGTLEIFALSDWKDGISMN